MTDLLIASLIDRFHETFLAYNLMTGQTHPSTRNLHTALLPMTGGRIPPYPSPSAAHHHRPLPASAAPSSQPPQPTGSLMHDPRTNSFPACHPFAGFLFTHEDVDMALYGYAKNRTDDQMIGHSLSGLRIGELTYGRSLCLATCLIVCPFACLSACLSVCLTVRLCVFVYSSIILSDLIQPNSIQSTFQK